MAPNHATLKKFSRRDFAGACQSAQEGKFSILGAGVKVGQEGGVALSVCPSTSCVGLRACKRVG